MSDQDNYMEGIVALIKSYILHQKLPKSVKNSWRYWGFSCNFAYFADFEDPNWSVLREGAVCSWSLYGMHYRADRALEVRPNGFRLPCERMEILRFSIPILLILLTLLIFRTSTDQRLRKELSVQDTCMGWIVISNERLNSIETDWESHKNSWRCWGFSSQFCWFCWFWGFQLVSASWRSGLFKKFVWHAL